MKIVNTQCYHHRHCCCHMVIGLHIGLSTFSFLLSHHQYLPTIFIMATQGPNEYSTEEERSFCDRIRYWIGDPIQVHMLRSVQIDI